MISFSTDPILCLWMPYNIGRIVLSWSYWINFFVLQDLQNEGNLPLEEVSVDDILEAQRQEQQKKQDEQKTQNKKLLERGLQPHAEGTADDFTWAWFKCVWMLQNAICTRYQVQLSLWFLPRIKNGIFAFEMLQKLWRSKEALSFPIKCSDILDKKLVEETALTFGKKYICVMNGCFWFCLPVTDETRSYN